MSELSSRQGPANWIVRFTRSLFGRRRAFFFLMGGLSGAGVGAAVYAYVDAAEIYEYTDTVDGVHLPEVDAIVVLAGGRGRIAAASDLWYRYWEHAQNGIGHAPVLYISGMGPRSTFRSLEQQVRQGVMPVIRAEDVVIERESGNTVENAQWAERIGREKHWRSILLMTSSYHMKRSRLIFERIFQPIAPPVKIETLSVIQEPFAADEWRSSLHGARVTLSEYFKLLYFRNFWKP